MNHLGVEAYRQWPVLTTRNGIRIFSLKRERLAMIVLMKHMLIIYDDMTRRRDGETGARRAHAVLLRETQSTLIIGWI